MKKFLIVLSLIVSLYIVFVQATPAHSVNVFYVDRCLHRLIPIEKTTQKRTIQHQAEDVIALLCSGRKSEQNLQLIPNIKGGISVLCKNRCANVTLSDEVISQITSSKDTEYLVIYQIVNSLTSIDGIDTVQFNSHSNQQFRFLNINEIFTPNYDI